MIDAPELSPSQRAMLAALRGAALSEARQHGASATYLNYAKLVLRFASELANDVVEGRLTLDAAVKVATARRDAGQPPKLAPTEKLHLNTQQRLQRDERIRLMAEEGFDEEGIAQGVGVSLGHVRNVMHRLGIPTLKERLGLNHRVDADKAMAKLVDLAQPPGPAIAAIDWDQLDTSRLREWERQLDSAIKEWSALRKRLRRAINDNRRTSPSASVILAVDPPGGSGSTSESAA